MRSLTDLDTYDAETGWLNVIIETPQGSRNKYKYDERRRVFALHSLLPAGTIFPYDFGFLPSTRGEDGDPLDVLVLMEEPCPGGYVVPARLIGVIEAEQTEDGTTERNDRLIAASTESHCRHQMNTLGDLGDELLAEIEHFFISYNDMQGKQFKPLGRHGPARAHKLVKQGEKRFRQPMAGKKKARAGK